MEEQIVFKKVPNEVMQIIEKALIALQNRVESAESKRLISLALVNIAYHPMPPLNNIIISFRLKDVSFCIVYTDYKIELSDYISINTGMGYDHEQSFNFKYQLEGYTEEEGDLNMFEYELTQALSEIPISEISISDEE